jgi:hypothetical protein
MANGVLTIDDFKEEMRKIADLGPACPYTQVICNDRMAADARLVPISPSVKAFGGLGIRYNDLVPDGYLVLSDGKKIVGIIGPNKDASN